MKQLRKNSAESLTRVGLLQKVVNFQQRPIQIKIKCVFSPLLALSLKETSNKSTSDKTKGTFFMCFMFKSNSIVSLTSTNSDLLQQKKLMYLTTVTRGPEQIFYNVRSFLMNRGQHCPTFTHTHGFSAGLVECQCIYNQHKVRFLCTASNIMGKKKHQENLSNLHILCLPFIIKAFIC